MQHIAPITRCMASARQETLNGVSHAAGFFLRDGTFNHFSYELAYTLLIYGSIFTPGPSPGNPPKRSSVGKVLSPV
jgi:hypothetical protein